MVEKTIFETITTDPISMFFIYLAFICLSGFVGGVARCLHQNKDNSDYKKTPITKIVINGFIGVAGAFGIVFLSLSVNQIILNACFDIKGMMFIVSSCVIAGFMSTKVFSKLSKPFEEQIADMKESVNENIEEVQEKMQKQQKEVLAASQKAIKYSEALSLAETAFDRKKKPEIENAINAINNIKDCFKDDRTLHIYLGRLYRLDDDLKNAIRSLRSFISNIENEIDSTSTTVYKTHAAAAYFNIACYHSLLAEKTKHHALEMDRMLKEAHVALLASIKLYPEYEKTAETDPDLDFYRKINK